MVPLLRATSALMLGAKTVHDALFSQAGWDVFTLDYENFGLSSRSPVFQNPTKYPESEMLKTTEVDVNDLERVVDFSSRMRGVKKVSLFGWSFGVIKSAPIYTIRHTEKVDKLVLFGAFTGPQTRSNLNKVKCLKN